MIPACPQCGYILVVSGRSKLKCANGHSYFTSVGAAMGTVEVENKLGSEIIGAMVITRGLPGSGKTTYAEQWVAEDVHTRARVNRDHLRLMAHKGKWVDGVTEPMVIAMRDAAIVALLKMGIDVIVDETCMKAASVQALYALGGRVGARVEMKSFVLVPLEECIRRDKERLHKDNGNGYVGRSRIKKMWEEFCAERDADALEVSMTVDDKADAE